MPLPPARSHETVERLVAEIRRVRPQVVITYGDDHDRYPHPDHIRVHDISVAAFDAAGDVAAFPAAGEPYQPLKMYFTVWSRARIVATHAKFLELGMESPFDESWLERPSDDDKITTSIDLKGFEDVRRLALLGPRDPGRPDLEVLVRAASGDHEDDPPHDDYILARSLVETRSSRGRPLCRRAPPGGAVAGVRLPVGR